MLVMAVASCWALNLSGAGATFPYPIYSKWFDVYAQRTNVHINYQSIGSGGGIKQLQARTVDFGASDAPLSDAEIQSMPAQVAHIPTVAGAVVIAYNLPGVGKGLRFTPEIIAGLFLGQITRWNDPRLASANPNVHLPALAITVAHRADGSGTTYIFTHYLSAINGEWARKIGSGKSVNWPVGVGGKGNEGVAGVIKDTPGGVGYIELAYAVQNQIPYGNVKNKSGSFIEPSVASTTAAAAGAVSAMKKDIRVSIVNSPGRFAYPIAGFTYILVYRNTSDASKGNTLKIFLNWAIHDGQQYTSSLLYASLPPAVVRMNEATIKSLR
jgi:phosphate transport system substrate-binding protein